MPIMVNPSFKRRPWVALDNLDPTDDVTIEFGQFLCRHPKFLVGPSARDLYRVLPGEVVANFKLSHKTNVARRHVFRIPITSDPSGVI
jgi:hypothetical protein